MAKNVALAVVVFPNGVLMPAGTIQNQDMIRKIIEQDLQSHPDLRAKAEAIEDIFIVSNEKISSKNERQDMLHCYVRHSAANGWARSNGLHLTKALLPTDSGTVTVYVAYGTLFTEPHIDYSDSQVAPSDNGLYVDPPAWDELASQDCSAELPA